MVVENTIEIEASPSTVWAVTTDVERWPEWTPTVTSVELTDGKPLGPGSKVRIKQPGQPEAEWTVSAYRAGKFFEWESRRSGLTFRATHIIKVDGTGSACTVRLEATGFLSVLLWPLLRPAVGRALNVENKSLKARCEEQPEP